MITPIQQDSWNCGIGAALARMQFLKVESFQFTTFSNNWIDERETS